MDVDRFKEVNDTLGHDVGDRLLQDIGSRLRKVEGGETVVARLGGDEFAVLLGGEDVHVEGIVARITRDIGRSFHLGDVTLDVTASIGIAVTPRDGASAALLLRRAEVAMYDAKVSLSGVARYSPDRDPYSSRRLSLIGDLGRALAEGTLELHYQPQADPVTGQVSCVEALLRWNHPVWGQVPPDEFIPLAEHTGLIRPLTRFVVETAVHRCVAWRDAGTPVLMAVNISARNLLEPELADTVARVLVQAGLPASMLKLEVTESAIVADPERAVLALERLVELGLSISVDDFGTGYASWRTSGATSSRGTSWPGRCLRTRCRRGCATGWPAWRPRCTPTRPRDRRSRNVHRLSLTAGVRRPASVRLRRSAPLTRLDAWPSFDSPSPSATPPSGTWRAMPSWCWAWHGGRPMPVLTSSLSPRWH